MCRKIFVRNACTIKRTTLRWHHVPIDSVMWGNVFFPNAGHFFLFLNKAVNKVDVSRFSPSQGSSNDDGCWSVLWCQMTSEESINCHEIRPKGCKWWLHKCGSFTTSCSDELKSNLVASFCSTSILKLRLFWLKINSFWLFVPFLHWSVWFSLSCHKGVKAFHAFRSSLLLKSSNHHHAQTYLAHSVQ